MKITSQQLRRMIRETAVDLEARLDIVDGDTGEIYALAHDEDGWNDAPYSGLAADFEIWLSDNSKWFGGRHVDFIKHPDAEALSQEHGNNAWYVRHPDEAPDYRTEDLVGQYNLPSGGWGIPEPGRGTTREGTDKMKITQTRLEQIIREELRRVTEVHWKDCPENSGKASDYADHVGHPMSSSKNRFNEFIALMEILEEWDRDASDDNKYAECIEMRLANAFNSPRDPHMLTMEFAREHLKKVQDAGTWVSVRG